MPASIGALWITHNTMNRVKHLDGCACNCKLVQHGKDKLQHQPRALVGPIVYSETKRNKCSDPKRIVKKTQQNISWDHEQQHTSGVVIIFSVMYTAG